MPHRRAPFIKDHYYHIYNRGVNKENIFRCHENYIFLLQKLKTYTFKYNIAPASYCLMPNHYHFLLKQCGDISISQLMHSTFNSYSKAFNNQHQRTGPLFESRFKSILIDSDEYLMHLFRYIHRNPFEAGLAKKIEDWPYSNYMDCIGKREGVLKDDVSFKMFFKSTHDYYNFVHDTAIDIPNNFYEYCLETN